MGRRVIDGTKKTPTALFATCSGQGFRTQRRLEGEFSSNNQPAGLAVGKGGITEAGELKLQPGILNERVYAEEVGVVENVGRGGMDFK